MSKRRSLRGLLDGLASVAMIVAAATLVWVIVSGRSSGPGTAPAAIERLEGEDPVFLSSTSGVKGAETAQLALIEFSDFQCPFCGQYARDVYPRLQQEFVETGKVRYVFRHYPLSRIHPVASKAAEAVECAAEGGMYWSMHDQLFNTGGNLQAEDLPAFAATLGLDVSRFQTCLDSGVMLSRVVEDQQLARQLGVTSTPTFIIAEIQPDGGLRSLARMKGAQSYVAFESALDEFLDGL